MSKANRKDLLASRSEAKSAKRELTVTMTKAQKIKDENASSAKYAAAAGTVMVIVYEFVKGTPPHGWGRYDDFANHEIVYSTAQVLLGIAMAWALRTVAPLNEQAAADAFKQVWRSVGVGGADRRIHLDRGRGLCAAVSCATRLTTCWPD